MPTALAIHVRGDSSDVLDESGFGPSFELKIVSPGMSLISHLGDELRVSGCHLDQPFTLAKGVSQRFFHIDMLA